MKYAFIWRHRKQFKIARLCGALGVSRSGFYDWLSRPESRHAVEDRELLRQIRALHVQARQARKLLRQSQDELVHHQRFATREQARARIFDYIEVFYNRQRAHATLRFLSPVEFETVSLGALQPCPGNPG